MIEEIGNNAGLVWEYLDAKGETSLATLKRNLKMKDAPLHLALGWLAREGKVYFAEKDSKILLIGLN